MNTGLCSVALIATVVCAGDASAQVTGTPMVIWSKPQGPDDQASAAKPAPRGPSPHQLTMALADQSGASKLHLRGVACGADSQEITRFNCAYEQQDASGAWRRWSAHVTSDAGHWRLAGTPVAEQ